MTFEEMKKKEEKENKKKWISKQGFANSVNRSLSKSLLIPNYVNLTPSESPLNHHFRDIKKSKWINEKGFF